MKISQEKTAKGRTIFHLTLGYSELEALNGLLIELYQKLPKKVFEIRPFRSRIMHMKECIGHAVEEYKVAKEGGWNYDVNEYVNTHHEEESLGC